MLHKKTLKQAGYSLFFVMTTFLLSSCGGPKNLVYFTDIQIDSVVQALAVPPAIKIKPGDVLSIKVSSSDESSVARINGGSSMVPASGIAAAAGASSASSSAPGASYLVNDSGIIVLPLVGKLYVNGLEKEQVADSIMKVLLEKKLVLDAFVNVKITNFKVTVLGEVNRPGVIAVPEEKITLTEALSQAGDMTIYGKRDNVLIIRTVDGQRIYKRIDLTKNDFFNSEYYYLNNQDILYIEPSKKKDKLLDNSTQTYSLILSTLSLLAIIYTQIAR